jgi:hypothetical protein
LETLEGRGGGGGGEEEEEEEREKKRGRGRGLADMWGFHIGFGLPGKEEKCAECDVSSGFSQFSVKETIYSLRP